MKIMTEKAFQKLEKKSTGKVLILSSFEALSEDKSKLQDCMYRCLKNKTDLIFSKCLDKFVIDFISYFLLLMPKNKINTLQFIDCDRINKKKQIKFSNCIKNFKELKRIVLEWVPVSYMYVVFEALSEKNSLVEHLSLRINSKENNDRDKLMNSLCSLSSNKSLKSLLIKRINDPVIFFNNFLPVLEKNTTLEKLKIKHLSDLSNANISNFAKCLFDNKSLSTIQINNYDVVNAFLHLTVDKFKDDCSEGKVNLNKLDLLLKDHSLNLPQENLIKQEKMLIEKNLVLKSFKNLNALKVLKSVYNDESNSLLNALLDVTKLVNNMKIKSLVFESTTFLDTDSFIPVNDDKSLALKTKKTVENLFSCITLETFGINNSYISSCLFHYCLKAIEKNTNIKNLKFKNSIILESDYKKLIDLVTNNQHLKSLDVTGLKYFKPPLNDLDLSISNTENEFVLKRKSNKCSNGLNPKDSESSAESAYSSDCENEIDFENNKKNYLITKNDEDKKYENKSLSIKELQQDPGKIQSDFDENEFDFEGEVTFCDSNLNDFEVLLLNNKSLNELKVGKKLIMQYSDIVEYVNDRKNEPSDYLTNHLKIIQDNRNISSIKMNIYNYLMINFLLYINYLQLFSLKNKDILKKENKREKLQKKLQFLSEVCIIPQSVSETLKSFLSKIQKFNRKNYNLLENDNLSIMRAVELCFDIYKSTCNNMFLNLDQNPDDKKQFNCKQDVFSNDISTLNKVYHQLQKNENFLDKKQFRLIIYVLLNGKQSSKTTYSIYSIPEEVIFYEILPFLFPKLKRMKEQKSKDWSYRQIFEIANSLKKNDKLNYLPRWLSLVGYNYNNSIYTKYNAKNNNNSLNTFIFKNRN